MRRTPPSPSDNELLHGRIESPIEPRSVRHGGIRLDVHGIDVRRVVLGGVPLLDRVYVAVRNPEWGTIPPVVSEVEVGPDRSHPFRMAFLARHRQGAIAFSWRGSIVLDANGVLTYEMDGTAEAGFRYARIGICVLHEAATWSGSAYEAETPGGRIRGVLPTLIEPQWMVGGHEQALFAPFSAITMEREGTALELEFEGDLFETEDQRNWTDDSFKTYSTPIGLGYPHEASPGQRIRQRVTVIARGNRRRRSERAPSLVELQPGPALESWPAIGLGACTDDRPLATRELRLLRVIRPDHVRVDVHVAESGWQTRLKSAIADARKLDAAVELGCFAGPSDDARLAELATTLSGAAVSRVLVFGERTAESVTTPRGVVANLRERLSNVLPQASWIGGTDGDFAELNRDRPDLDGLDGLCWSVNPQVHASDELSMAETLRAQAMTLVTARAFAGDADLVVSPVTLKQRFKPVAAGPIERDAPGSLPAAVDHRQPSLFAAVWTVGSLASLIGAGAASITFFETAGSRGLMEWTDPPEQPDWPDWTRGRVFPVYHVFADLGGRSNGRPMPVASSNRDVVALGIGRTAGSTVLVANLRPVRVECELRARPGSTALVRMLDIRSALMAMDQPGRYREHAEPTDTSRGVVRCVLGPYAVARIDLEDAARGRD